MTYIFVLIIVLYGVNTLMFVLLSMNTLCTYTMNYELYICHCLLNLHICTYVNMLA